MMIEDLKAASSKDLALQILNNKSGSNFSNAALRPAAIELAQRILPSYKSKNIKTVGWGFKDSGNGMSVSHNKYKRMGE